MKGTSSLCPLLQPFTVNPLNKVSTLYSIWFWLIVSIVLLLWLLAMILLLLPITNRLSHYIFLMFIFFDLKSEEVKTPIDVLDFLSSQSGLDAQISYQSMQRQKEYHGGYAKVFHVQKSKTALGGIITVFMLITSAVLATHLVLNFLDPTKQQITPSTINIRQETDYDDSSDLRVDLFLLFRNRGTMPCNKTLTDYRFDLLKGSVGHINYTVSEYNGPKYCLLRFEDTYPLAPNYRASAEPPSELRYSLSWDNTAPIMLREALIKSEAVYFNDKADKARNSIKFYKLSSQQLFSQSHYCIDYSTSSNATLVDVSSSIISFLFPKNWFYDQSNIYLPFCQTLSFPQNQPHKNRLDPHGDRALQMIQFKVTNGETFSVVFPSILTLVISMLSLSGGTITLIPICRFFVNRIVRWFISYPLFKVCCIISLVFLSLLGSLSYFILRTNFDQWIVLTGMAAGIPLGTAVVLTIHSLAACLVKRNKMKEDSDLMDWHRSIAINEDKETDPLNITKRDVFFV